MHLKYRTVKLFVFRLIVGTLEGQAGHEILSMGHSFVYPIYIIQKIND